LPVNLALDLGTTSLAGRLLDQAGRCLAEGQVPNRQAKYGADVLRRLEAARAGNGASLQSILVDCVNELVDGLLQSAGSDANSIQTAAAAANPAISLLFQNRPVDSLLVPPYKPADCSAVHVAADEVGLQLSCPVYLFPLINGFVGGDLVAFLFGQPSPKTPTLFVDVGTNGEIALFVDGQWWVTSVAAGPAFEGGEIGSGMLYGPGAIMGVKVQGDRFVLDVVTGQPPAGVCGSGLAEAVAVAIDAGLIDRHGSIVSPGAVESNLSRYLVPHGDGFAISLYRDAHKQILIEQKDVRNFQLAKAAVHAGVECLLQKAAVETSDIAEVVLTGAFGFSLSKEALKKVALLPANMVDRVRFEPGGALAGVSKMLWQEDGRMQVEALAKKLKPYPLSGSPEFEKAFVAAIDF